MYASRTTQFIVGLFARLGIVALAIARAYQGFAARRVERIGPS
jgi:uncharacterized membrane protein